MNSGRVVIKELVHMVVFIWWRMREDLRARELVPIIMQEVVPENLVINHLLC